MKKFMERLREPSSWAGLAAVIYGVGQVAKIDEAPAVADAVATVGTTVASGGDPITGGLMALAGVLAVLLREKGKR